MISKGIELYSNEDAAKRALELIESEMNGIQTGYKSRYSKLNTSMMKWFRPGVILLGGLSTAGKSTLVNNLESDFVDPILNANADQPAVVIHFNYEIPAYYELLRTVSSKVQKSFAYLLSSEYNGETREYNQLTQAELALVKEALTNLALRKIYYVKSHGNINAMNQTVDQVMKKHPDCRPIIIVDHTLLIRKDDEGSDGELIQNTAMFCHEQHHNRQALCIMIHQFNNEILKVERLLNPQLHIPKASDLYYGSQIYWACDDVFLMHRPEKLGLIHYSPRKLLTTNLVHISKEKSRYNLEGNIYFHNKFHTGELVELTSEQVTELSNKKPTKI